MAANYGRPKPVDPLWYRSGWSISIHCACGRHHVQRLDRFAAERAIPRDLQLGPLIDRLRCSQCGARPSAEFIDRRL